MRSPDGSLGFARAVLPLTPSGTTLTFEQVFAVSRSPFIRHKRANRADTDGVGAATCKMLDSGVSYIGGFYCTYDVARCGIILNNGLMV